MWRYFRNHTAGHAVRIVSGWFFIVLGILGLVLPILQGILFLAVGALLLSPYVPFFRRLKLRIYWKFPRIRWTVERWRRQIRGKFGRPPGHKTHGKRHRG